MTYIRRSAYDALYDANWDERKFVDLYGDGSVPISEVLRFAHFMSKNLGFRLKVTFPHDNFTTIRFTKVD